MFLLLQILLFFSFYSVFVYFVAKIRNLPPGPFPALPVIGHLHLIKKPLHRSLAKISAKYGAVLLLKFGSRRVLVVSSPAAAEECFTTNDIAFANRPRLLAGKHIGYNYNSVVWSSYGDHWRNLRRISSIEVLSSNRLQMLSAIRADEVRLLVRRLIETQGEAVDMKSAFFAVTMNVMMRMIAGKRYYGGDEAEADEARRFRDIVTETLLLGSATTADFLPFLKWVGNGEKRLIKLQKNREEFMQALLEQGRKRIESGEIEKVTADFSGGKKTLIEVLLSLQKAEPEHYQDEIIRSLMLSLLAAGSDTSAGTMEWAMSLLVNHPEVLKKAQIEIDNVVGNNRLVKESDMSNLPYLHCIINETMRMFPAGPLLVPHESAKECKIGGFNVPSGTMLLVNLWAIQNDPKLWEEPNRFKPERFEGMEGVRDGFKMMPFGSGRRSCPGEGLAMRIVGLTVGTLIQCFEWEREGKELVDLSEGLGLTMPKAQPLLAKARPRRALGNVLSGI